MHKDRTDFRSWVRKWKIGPGMNDRWRAENRKNSVAKEFYDGAKENSFVQKLIGKENIDEGARLIDDGLYSGFDGTVGPGWIPILDDLARDLYEMGWNGDLHQTKEKFGTLRFYIGYPEGISEELMKKMEARVSEAEKLSSQVCEECGAPGTLRMNGWWRTNCDPCEAKRGKL